MSTRPTRKDAAKARKQDPACRGEVKPLQPPAITFFFGRHFPTQCVQILAVFAARSAGIITLENLTARQIFYKDFIKIQAQQSCVYDELGFRTMACDKQTRSFSMHLNSALPVTSSYASIFMPADMPKSCSLVLVCFYVSPGNHASSGVEFESLQ